jgi:hypothetical protein
MPVMELGPVTLPLSAVGGILLVALLVIGVIVVRTLKR